jgi:hypothetical protein
VVKKRGNSKKQQNDELLRVEDFYKRWNIQVDETERWKKFKNRVLNIYKSDICKKIEKSESTDEFFNLIGIHRIPKDIFNDDIFGGRHPIYDYFINANTTQGILLGLEVIFWMKTITIPAKKLILKHIQDVIVITGVPLVIKQTHTGVLFYPAGAKLLDEKLVDDNLDWLLQYSKSYDAFKSALLKVGKKGEERNIVDGLRLSLELLIKDILKNKKSLEKQQNEIGIYLKSKNVSVEIANLFWTVLDYYSKYQNNRAKHDDVVAVDEVEFILFLTGVLMRFLLTK